MSGPGHAGAPDADRPRLGHVRRVGRACVARLAGPGARAPVAPSGSAPRRRPRSPRRRCARRARSTSGPSSRPFAARSSCCTARTRRSSRWRCRTPWPRRCPTLGSSCCRGRPRACSSRTPRAWRTGSRRSRPRRRRPRPTLRRHPSGRPRGRRAGLGAGARNPLAARGARSCAPSPQGDTNAEIAASLGISVNTVERHVSNVYRKIDARGRADATAWALRHGLA